MSRRDFLQHLDDQAVRDWLAPRRAQWQIAIDNTGIDGNVGAIIRGHNIMAGGGIQLLHKAGYNKRVTMGTHHHEPTRILDNPAGNLIITVEADSNLPPLPDRLVQDATYVIGHDGVGIRPQIIRQCHMRFGPPSGWSNAVSSGVLAHLLMKRLRAGESLVDIPLCNEYNATPLYPANIEWQKLTKAQQRMQLPMDWWVDRFKWNTTRDWWVWVPHSQTGLNTVMTCRIAQAAGANGIITSHYPGPQIERMNGRWRVESNRSVLSWAAKKRIALIGLEHGGEIPRLGSLPARAILIAGHEQEGLHTDIRAQCDGIVTLPQWGSCNSYNMSNAVALALDYVQTM